MYSYKLQGVEYINEKKFYEGDYFFDKKWNGIFFDENLNIINEIKNGMEK